MQHLIKIFCLLALSVISSFAHAQINMKVGDLEIKQRSLRPSDVQTFIDRKEYKTAKEIALQCFKETAQAWCEYYAGTLTFGAPGLEANEKEGLRMIRSAANKNVSSAQVFIGNLHFNGGVLPKSSTEALSWWTKAANNCNGWAQNALARTYFDGKHIKRNVPEAYYWISLAAYYQFPNADTGMEVVGEKVSGKEKNKTKERVSRFIETSECGKTPEKPVVHDQWSE